MRYLATLSLLLAGLWLTLSGLYKPLLLALGVASIGLVAWLSHRMDVLGAEHDPALFSWRLPAFWVWLVGQIVVSNLTVAACVLRPSRLSPEVVRVPATQRTQVARVTYGNSITLTPGTVTLALEADHLVVHALTADTAAGLRRGTMAKWVDWLEAGKATVAT